MLGRGVGDPRERIQFVGGGALPVCLEQFGGFDLARAELGDRVGRGQLDQVGHCAVAPGLGTPKPPSTGSGAAASTASRGRHGIGTSSRSTLKMSTTWDVGGTSVEVELSDPLHVVEHLGQLGRHPLDLVVVEVELGQTGDV